MHGYVCLPNKAVIGPWIRADFSPNSHCSVTHLVHPSVCLSSVCQSVSQLIVVSAWFIYFARSKVCRYACTNMMYLCLCVCLLASLHSSCLFVSLCVWLFVIVLVACWCMSFSSTVTHAVSVCFPFLFSCSWCNKAVRRRRRRRRSAAGNGARNGGSGWRRLRRQSGFHAPKALIPVVSLPSAFFDVCLRHCC